jgi:FtsH-binding integral membrane protein
MYLEDSLRDQAQSLKWIAGLVLVGLIVLLVGMRLMPESSTPLLAKVMSLLCPTIATAACGAYVGRHIRGFLPFIGLLIVSIIGIFIVRAAGGSLIATPLLLGWGFVNGMMLGPLVGFALAEEGPQVVVQALVGTTAVMLIAAFIALATGINFSFLWPVLFLGLIGLLIMGLISIFVRFSRTVSLVYSIFGMIIFAGYFLFDFFRLGQSANTWEKATQLTLSLYLDFANFFVYLLQFLLASRRK